MTESYVNSYLRVQSMKTWVLSHLLAELKEEPKITITTDKLVEMTKLTNHQVCRCMGDLLKTLPGAMQLDPESFVPGWIVCRPNLSQMASTLWCIVHNPYCSWNPDSTPETPSPEVEP